MIHLIQLSLRSILLAATVFTYSFAVQAQQSWTSLGNLPSADLQIDIDACGRLWAHTPHHFYVSEDLGATWQEVQETISPEIELSDFRVSEAGPLIGYTMHARYGYANLNQLPCGARIALPDVLAQPGVNGDSLLSNPSQAARQNSNYLSPFPPVAVVDDQVLIYTFREAARQSPAQFGLAAMGAVRSPYYQSGITPTQPLGFVFLATQTGDSLAYTNMPRSSYVFEGIDTFKITAPQGLDSVLYASRAATTRTDTSVIVYRKRTISDSLFIANFYWQTQTWEETQSIFATGEIQVLPKGYEALLIRSDQGYHYSAKRGSEALRDLTIAAQEGQMVGYVPQEDGVLLVDDGQYYVANTSGMRAIAHRLGDAVEALFIGDSEVVGFDGSAWYAMSPTAPAVQLDVTNGYDFSTISSGNITYTQTITPAGLVFLARASTAADTLFRAPITNGKWRVQGDTQTPVITQGSTNFALINGEAVRLSGFRQNSTLALRGMDTLYLSNTGETTLRKGNGEVFDFPAPDRQNPSFRSVYAAENGFVLCLGWEDNGPRLRQTTLYGIDPNNPAIPEIITRLTGEQRYAVIADQLLSFRSDFVTDPVTAADYSSGRTATGMQIAIPTQANVSFGAVRISDSGFSFYTNDLRKAQGAVALDFTSNQLAVAGIGGVYIRDAACLFSPVRSSVECLAQGETLQWNGLTIDESGTYTTQLQIAGCVQDSSIEVVASGNFQFPSYCLGRGGDTYFFGQEALRPGTYTSTQMVNGCPRTYSIEAFGSYFTVGETPVCIDTNEVYDWNGMLLTERGTYYQNRPDTLGCMIPYAIQIQQRNYNLMMFDTICQGETYWFDNEEIQFDLAGDYQNLAVVTNLCRDTLRQNLTVLPGDTLRVDTLVTIGEDLFGTMISANGQVVLVPNTDVCTYTAYTATVVSSIEDQPDADKLSLSPNPASEEVVLRYPRGFATAQDVRLMDAAGRILHSTVWPAGQLSLTLEVASLPAGVYVIWVGEYGVERVVVQ